MSDSLKISKQNAAELKNYFESADGNEFFKVSKIYQ